MGEVLDVDGLLVQDEDVSGDGVRGPVEGAEVQRVILVLAPAQASQGHQDYEQRAGLEIKKLEHRKNLIILYNLIIMLKNIILFQTTQFMKTDVIV